MMHKSGYQGHDSMRNKAEAIFSKDGGNKIIERPGSFSSADNEKMRLFKKGGHVKHTSEMRKSMKGRTKSMIHEKTPLLNLSTIPMKKGGRAKMHKKELHHLEEAERLIHKEPMRKGGKTCYAMGGVGKIRHKQATPSGMPIKKKSRSK